MQHARFQPFVVFRGLDQLDLGERCFVVMRLEIVFCAIQPFVVANP